MEIIKQAQATNESYQQLQENYNRPLGLVGTDTGHHTMNLVFGGWRPGKIVSYAARSGHNKTSILIQMVKAAGRIQNGRRSDIRLASWELRADEMVTRQVSHTTGFSSTQLMYPKILTASQRDLIKLAYAEASKYPVSYQVNSTNWTNVEKMLSIYVDECKAKEQIEGIKIQPVFCLDFIGMLEGNGRYNSRTYDVGDFMKALKSFCNKTGLAAFLLCQINRTADSRELPEIQDISDSSSIENNSDVVILGHRPEKLGKMTMKDFETNQEIPSTDLIYWLVRKNRNGKESSMILNIKPATHRFWDRSLPSWDYDYTRLYGEQQFWLDLHH